MTIDAKGLHFSELNEKIKGLEKDTVELMNVTGQRYIGSGTGGKNITINGVPGNALGAYLNGSNIKVLGNAQDATGDTMNNGEIVIFGSSGDATGYAMRGGKIFIRDHSGYRAGIHMKAYKEQVPVIVIGGTVGAFLGEYQAGGIIIVLGEGNDGFPVGSYYATGMHGGKIFIRSKTPPPDVPAHLSYHRAEQADLDEIKDYLSEFCQHFDRKFEEVTEGTFYVFTPNSKNPYKQLYTHN